MILIRGAHIIDGSGKPAVKGDVLLRGDRISAIGNFPGRSADITIDALGMHLAPGFIDVNTDSDHYLTLFSHPAQSSFLRQGVTTIIGGNCGASLAPLLYGSLESVEKWGSTNQVNVNWHSVGEFLKILGKFKLGVNFGTLVGHTTVRRALIGEGLRDLTEPELRVFMRILTEGLRDGALGLSTGLGYVHSRETPYAELRALARVVAEHGGVYTTHLRDERSGLLAAVNETVRLAEETRVRAVISHLRPIKGFENEFESALVMVERSEADLHFDTYPFDQSIVPLYVLLPLWAQNGGIDVMRANIASPLIRERIMKEFPSLAPDDIVVAAAPGAEYLVGKTLGAFSQNRGLNLHEGLIELMRATRLRAVVHYKNINLDWAVRSLASSRAFVASNSASVEEGRGMLIHERAYRTFPHFLETAVGFRMLTIEEAVAKITSAPARKFRLGKRGELREGFYADLVLLKDRAVSHVFVNGAPVVSEGRLLDARPGRVLARS